MGDVLLDSHTESCSSGFTAGLPVGQLFEAESREGVRSPSAGVWLHLTDRRILQQISGAGGFAGIRKPEAINAPGG
jgi:hypothetical protein